TYFEGEVPHNTKARHGRSKEKRTDCPLVTLGLVLDGSGFVRRSQTFAGIAICPCPSLQTLHVSTLKTTVNIKFTGIS
ncbi:MAG: hypothetical protein LUQ68_06750, partial [Methylococcaceae bacterium]|nr:hypothetical protein [Methylococcaceae bacterium]